MQVLYTNPETLRNLHGMVPLWRGLSPREKRIAVKAMVWNELNELQQENTFDIIKHSTRVLRNPEYVMKQRQVARDYMAHLLAHG